MESFYVAEAPKTFALVLLSIILLPVSGILILLASLVKLGGLTLTTHQACMRTDQPFKRRRVLVTGVGMAKGLAIARLMYRAGHHVVGADVEHAFIPCPGRFSRAITRFIRLVGPNDCSQNDVYIQSLLRIIKHESIDLWISCSGVSSAIQDALAKEVIEQQTKCRCIQFGAHTTAILHEKNSFIKHTTSIGLPVPLTYNITSHSEAIERLVTATEGSNSGRKFILKPVGVDDRYRANMTLLPHDSFLLTRQYISALPISQENPWILQEFIAGGKEFCTHALVVQGQVMLFVACPSAELLMHYDAIPVDHPFTKAMLSFTQDFLDRSQRQHAWSEMTGHLSFDFMCSEQALYNPETGYGSKQQLFAIECNPRAHTAVVLFSDSEASRIQSISNAYMAALTPLSTAVKKPSHSRAPDIVYTSEKCHSRYWIGHDIVTELFQKIIQSLQPSQWRSFDLRLVAHNISSFLHKLFYWSEGTFTMWDPIPFLILYHVYLPCTILNAWVNRQGWSRMNLSTTKMFEK